MSSQGSVRPTNLIAARAPINRPGLTFNCYRFTLAGLPVCASAVSSVFYLCRFLSCIDTAGTTHTKQATVRIIPTFRELSPYKNADAA